LPYRYGSGLGDDADWHGRSLHSSPMICTMMMAVVRPFDPDVAWQHRFHTAARRSFANVGFDPLQAFVA
jgi:hypothetical protein